jgi:hypothetical protein
MARTDKGARYRVTQAKSSVELVEKQAPTEAVFRIDLATGKMRITDQKGDELPEDSDVTQQKIADYGIDTENSKFLAVLFYAKCNAKHGGCVWKMTPLGRVLIW